MNREPDHHDVGASPRHCRWQRVAHRHAAAAAPRRGLGAGRPRRSATTSLSCATTPQKKADADRRPRASARPTARKLCRLFRRFVAAEAKVVKFLEDNKAWCGVPPQAIASSEGQPREDHEIPRPRSAARQPRREPDSADLERRARHADPRHAKNTKTGRGTFDTLTGNPLAK